jgi:aminoglycoside phosphotransferase (APT) family kinase protein
MRVLLPTAPPRTAACLGDAMHAQGLAAIGVDVREAHAAASVDLVIASDPSASILRDAAAAVRPGGAVYVESPRSFLFGRRRLSRALHAAGFVDVMIYWRSSRNGLTSLWVPLEAEGAGEWFLRRRGRHRLFRRAAPHAFSFAHRMDVLAPLAAVARKPPRSSSENDDGVLELVARHWPDLGPLSWLVVAPGTRSISKLVGFVFAGGEPQPRLVVKTGRTAEANDALLREAAALTDLAARPAGTPPGAPRCLLEMRRPDGSPVIVETFVEGAPLYETLDAGTFQRLASAAAEWLVHLVDSDGAPRKGLPVAAEDALGEARDMLAASLAEHLRELAASVNGVLVAFEQRDFSPWNVLLDEQSRLGIVDWESAESDGLPLLDLVYFLANCGFILDGAETVESCVRSYRETFDRRTTRGAAAHRCMDDYIRRVGIAQEAVRPLRALTWLVHLLSARRRGIFEGGGTGLPSSAELFGALLEHELTFGAH